MADVGLRQQASAHSLGARARAAQRSAPLDLIPERCNTVPALVANTVGRGGRNNFPVIAVVAPVLDNSGQFYCSRAHMAEPDVAVWGAAPCSWPHRGRDAAPCTQGASTSSPAASARRPSNFAWPLRRRTTKARSRHPEKPAVHLRARGSRTHRPVLAQPSRSSQPDSVGQFR
jgi:hypothetical protein